MNFPLFATFAAKFNRVERFETAVTLLEQGIANKNIWNVDYVAAKDTLSNLWERASDEVYKPLMKFYYHEEPPRAYSWADNDPRRNLGLCQFMNTPGYLKKLRTVRNAPELEPYIALLAEAAKFATDFKAVKPFIVKGRKPSENPVEKDVTNTGICPVCMKRHKLAFNSTMVAHGYTIKGGYGGRNGMCVGHGYKAWEIAPDGAIAFKTGLEGFLKELNQTLTDLQQSNYPTMRETVRVRKEFGRFEDEKRVWDKGTPQYERIRQSSIHSTESQIRYVTRDIEELTARIDAWKPQPLKYGGAETQERWKSKLLQKGTE
jgi:hypothetical protein